MGGFFFLSIDEDRLAFAQCGEQILITSSVDNPTPYVGEQIIYTVRIDNSTRIEAMSNPPPFEGFWYAGSLEVVKRQESGCNGTIGVTIYERILFPLSPGEQVIPPWELSFTNNAVYDASTVVTSTETVVNVQPLPESAPDSFNGAVGLFPIMTAEIDERTIDSGDPLSLRLSIDGAGNIDQLNAPQLNLPDTWRVYPRPPITQANVEGTRLLAGVKRFEWLIFPVDTGALQIPAIELGYF
ncbi:MAG: BatD family protein, partial [Chloroflexota bacterium]